MHWQPIRLLFLSLTILLGIVFSIPGYAIVDDTSIEQLATIDADQDRSDSSLDFVSLYPASLIFIPASDSTNDYEIPVSNNLSHLFSREQIRAPPLL